ncbi:hypothetical protein [Inhella proteolytica]|uniref:Lipoprotein n=1 Tax=Inhella proteolytica TaxID=2795029 RepID=A0A931IZU5_9BURK|nr:hypothetical protein [Inhella proteolytica]MBH9576861.1 hypothetical protein [Inhella proteolytica]
MKARPILSSFQSQPRRALAAAALLASSLSACMVVPLEPHHLRQPPPAPAVLLQAAPLGPQVLQVRLYPLNAEATGAGPLSAVVMDNQNGKGSFSIAYQGRNLQGEATRVTPDYPGFGTLLSHQFGEGSARTSGRRGIANAAGTGVNAQCEYILTAANQGVGACLFSDGARYQMHFGQ